jgi:pyruvate formate lyase activating enzyme
VDALTELECCELCEHRDQLWELRFLVIPGITDGEVAPLCDFIASIDPDLPLCFLAFRPNFVLADHPGASLQLMQHCLAVARAKGLGNAHWSGVPEIPGRAAAPDPALADHYDGPAAHLAATYAARAGCVTHPRDCGNCPADCRVKGHLPQRVT